ncbi:sulfur carrier protein ThiS [Sporosarcina pasteurii]|uniref:Thiamine biosynthesis protein ThiS n=1 Tax=Sporosarcina pasteurii TaxID=1474 RepID=A0A380CJP4_SPOPA|nr:sulfur carrier protein ThiS [Sporosarcina pasteurii]MDS9472075.1 sulfur carrier protein ThiS [Sporosarcina pasteurii]QBQ06800.1 sulfur carrier protein ThiS [Sporosarcina pasteurii]SUJ20860.1 Thiamine biosynthesis protein ThiS [Sporosarcina pasteurii]
MTKTIELNGNTQEIPKDVESVQQLLEHLNLEERILIVELNKNILNKSAYDQPIMDRDQIEIIHFVGGG